jgi:hypothetical protein
LAKKNGINSHKDLRYNEKSASRNDRTRDTMVNSIINTRFQNWNCGLSPVIYALAKQIQWHWPEKYAEDKFVIMFGGLHIEMAALKSIGTLLQKSGWTEAIVEAGIASWGTAESFLSASSVTRTRQMHQATVSTL